MDPNIQDILFKKYLYTPTGFLQAPVGVEVPFYTSSKIIDATRQIYSDPIPGKAPVSDLSADITFPIELGQRYQTITGTKLAFYSKLQLDVIQIKDNKNYTFWSKGTSLATIHQNLLLNSIPYNYDSTLSYRTILYINNGSGDTEIPRASAQFSWILDSDSGILTFLNGIDPSYTVKLSFWRYEGPMGFDGLTGPTTANGSAGAIQFNNNGTAAGATGAIYDVSSGTIQITPTEDVSGFRTNYTTGDVYYSRTTSHTGQQIVAADFVPATGAANWLDVSGIKSGVNQSLYINPQETGATAKLYVLPSPNSSVRSVTYRFAFSSEGIVDGAATTRIYNGGEYCILFRNSSTTGKSVYVSDLSGVYIYYESQNTFYFEIQYAVESSEHVVFAGVSFAGLREVARIGNATYNGTTTIDMNHTGTAGTHALRDFMVFQLGYQPLMNAAISAKGPILIDTTQSSNPYGLEVLGSVHTTGSIQTDGGMFTTSSIIGSDITASSGLFVSNTINFYDISQGSSDYVLTYDPITGSVKYDIITNVGNTGSTGATGPTGAVGGQGATGPTGAFGTLAWTPVFINTSQLSSGSFSKTSGSANQWDAQLYSKEGFSRGAHISAKRVTTGICAFGLNSNPTTSGNYTNLEYGFYLSENSLYVQIGSTSPTLPVNILSNPRLSITYDGYEVRFYMDAALLYSTVHTVGTPLYFDARFYTAGVVLENVAYGPMGEAGPTGAKGEPGITGPQGPTGPVAPVLAVEFDGGTPYTVYDSIPGLDCGGVE